MNSKFTALFLCLAATVSGCAMDNPPYSDTDYTLAGGAIGAGTGIATAEVASAFLPGSIGAGAIVGGLIGIPIGAFVGYEIAESGNNSDLAVAGRQVQTNERAIAHGNAEIEKLRHQIINDEEADDTGDVNPDAAHRLYNGPRS